MSIRDTDPAPPAHSHVPTQQILQQSVLPSSPSLRTPQPHTYAPQNHPHLSPRQSSEYRGAPPPPSHLLSPHPSSINHVTPHNSAHTPHAHTPSSHRYPSPSAGSTMPSPPSSTQPTPPTGTVTPTPPRDTQYHPIRQPWDPEPIAQSTDHDFWNAQSPASPPSNITTDSSYPTPEPTTSPLIGPPLPDASLAPPRSIVSIGSRDFGTLHIPTARNTEAASEAPAGAPTHVNNAIEPPRSVKAIRESIADADRKDVTSEEATTLDDVSLVTKGTAGLDIVSLGEEIAKLGVCQGIIEGNKGDGAESARAADGLAAALQSAALFASEHLQPTRGGSALSSHTAPPKRIMSPFAQATVQPPVHGHHAPPQMADQKKSFLSKIFGRTESPTEPDTCLDPTMPLAPGVEQAVVRASSANRNATIPTVVSSDLVLLSHEVRRLERLRVSQLASQQADEQNTATLQEVSIDLQAKLTAIQGTYESVCNDRDELEAASGVLERQYVQLLRDNVTGSAAQLTACRRSARQACRVLTYKKDAIPKDEGTRNLEEVLQQLEKCEESLEAERAKSLALEERVRQSQAARRQDVEAGDLQKQLEQELRSVNRAAMAARQSHQEIEASNAALREHFCTLMAATHTHLTTLEKPTQKSAREVGNVVGVGSVGGETLHSQGEEQSMRRLAELEKENAALLDRAVEQDATASRLESALQDALEVRDRLESGSGVSERGVQCDGLESSPPEVQTHTPKDGGQIRTIEAESAARKLLQATLQHFYGVSADSTWLQSQGVDVSALVHDEDPVSTPATVSAELDPEGDADAGNKGGVREAPMESESLHDEDDPYKGGSAGPSEGVGSGFVDPISESVDLGLDVNARRGIIQGGDSDKRLATDGMEVVGEDSSEDGQAEKPRGLFGYLFS